MVLLANLRMRKKLSSWPTLVGGKVFTTVNLRGRKSVLAGQLKDEEEVVPIGKLERKKKCSGWPKDYQLTTSGLGNMLAISVKSAVQRKGSRMDLRWPIHKFMATIQKRKG